MTNPSHLHFDDTATAFRHQSTGALRKALLLFRSFDFPLLLRVGPFLAKVAIFLGLKGLIKNTIFAQFCGGETIEESSKAIEHLAESKVGTILDYSVEGEENEDVFDNTCEEIQKTISMAAGNEKIPFSVFKTTGIIRFELLQFVSEDKELTHKEEAEFAVSKDRFERICKKAAENNVKLFIDAEESWIQEAIDRLAEEMMAKYNRDKVIVFNTVQLYRHDRLEYLRKQIESTAHYLGFKLVRGAYMEKERERALDMGYASPIQPDKESTDRDYDLALELCMQHIDRVSICAGTHNEESSKHLVKLMTDRGLSPNDPHIYFSQLLGMSDHISFNLANSGYNVAKYVPYGPVSAVIPYLTRRARENSSVAGQMSRERGLIEKELRRRKALS